MATHDMTQAEEELRARLQRLCDDYETAIDTDDLINAIRRATEGFSPTEYDDGDDTGAPYDGPDEPEEDGPYLRGDGSATSSLDEEE